MAPDSGNSHDNLVNKAPSRKDIVIEEALFQVDRNSTVFLEVIGESLAAVRTNPEFRLTPEAVLNRVRDRVAEEAAARFEQREKENPMNLIKQAYRDAVDPNSTNEAKVAEILTDKLTGDMDKWKDALKAIVRGNRRKGLVTQMDEALRAVYYNRSDYDVSFTVEHMKPGEFDISPKLVVDNKYFEADYRSSYNMSPEYITRALQNLGVDIQELEELKDLPPPEVAKGGPAYTEEGRRALANGILTNVPGVTLEVDLSEQRYGITGIVFNESVFSTLVGFDKL